MPQLVILTNWGIQVIVFLNQSSFGFKIRVQHCCLALGKKTTFNNLAHLFLELTLFHCILALSPVLNSFKFKAETNKNPYPKSKG